MTPKTLRDSLLQTAFLTLTFTVLPLSAATLDWDGTTSTDFTLNTNWLTDVLPANDLTTDIARFSGTAPATLPTLNTTRSINGLIFDGTGYTLGGTGTLTLGSGGIQVTGTGTNTISVLLAGNNAPVSVANGATLNLSRSANTGFVQNFSGDGSIIFSGTNDGINNGQSSHGISGSNTGLTANATITANNSRLAIDNVADVGSARLINTGSGELWFSGATTYSNNMTIQGNGWGEVFGGGNIQLGAIRLGGSTLSGAVTLAGNTRMTAFGSTGTITGVINENGGARALEIGGGGATTGTIILTGASTYTGGTTVSGGTLQLGITASTDYGAIGRILGTLTVANSATLSLVGSNVLGYGAGTKVETLNINGGTVTTNVNGDNGWGLDIVMTGGTINGAGRISMGKGSASDGTSVTTNASATTAAISVGSMTLRSGNGLTGVDFTVADGAAATDLLVSSSLQAAGGAVGINKLGAGTMVLSGASTYAGTTNVNAGTLILNSTGSIASSAVAVANGATFQVDRTGKTLAGLSLAGGSRLNIAAGVGETTTSTGALTLSGGTVDVSIDLRSPIFTGQTINLVTAVSTTGTAPTFNTVLSTTGSRITGATSMVGNNLQFAATTGVGNLVWNNAAGTGIWDTNGAANFNNGGSNDQFYYLDVVTFGDAAVSKTVNVTGAVVPFLTTVNNTTAGGAYTFAGAGSLGGSNLVKNGDGTLTLGGTMTYGVGRTTVNNGTFNLGGKTVNGVESLTVTGGSVTNGTFNATTFDLQGGTVSAVLAGTGTLNKSTAGTTVLAGTNTLSGPSNVTAGTLQIGNGGTTGTLGTSAVAVSAGATVAFNRSDANTVANAFSGAGTLQKDSANNLTLSGALAQNLVVNSGTLTKTGGGFGTDVMTGNGLVTVNSGATLVIASGSAHAFGGGNGGMSESFVINGGTMTINQEQYFNNLTLNGATVNGSSELRASAATNLQVTGTAASVVSSTVSHVNNANWTVADVTSSSATDLTVSGAIINTGALNKAGAGTMVITGANTYTGATNVNAGTLLVNGNSSAAIGAVTVATGATLGGTGSIGGALNVTGTLAPGASIESLATGAVTLNAASRFSYELNSSNLTGDLLAVTGGLNIGTGALLDISDLSSVARMLGDKLTLINYSGSWNGGIWNGYADDSTFQLGSNTWQISYDDQLKGTNFNSEQLGLNSVTITVVPEPSVALLGSLGVMVLLRRRRNE